jgi:hypothetical protein
LPIIGIKLKKSVNKKEMSRAPTHKKEKFTGLPTIEKKTLRNEE